MYFSHAFSPPTPHCITISQLLEASCLGRCISPFLKGSLAHKDSRGDDEGNSPRMGAHDLPVGLVKGDEGVAQEGGRGRGVGEGWLQVQPVEEVEIEIADGEGGHDA